MPLIVNAFSGLEAACVKSSSRAQSKGAPLGQSAMLSRFAHAQKMHNPKTITNLEPQKTHGRYPVPESPPFEMLLFIWT
jgi:hypothetical protein